MESVARRYAKNESAWGHVWLNVLRRSVQMVVVGLLCCLPAQGWQPVVFGQILSSLSSLPDQPAVSSSATSDWDLDDAAAVYPLLHRGPWIETRQGVLPIESRSGGGQGQDVDLYDGLRGIELSDDSPESRMSLKLGGRIQVRYALLEDQGAFSNAGSNLFHVPRSRLGVRGFIFHRYLRYNLAADFGVGNARLVNAFAQVDLQDAIGIGFGNNTSLRYGYWRTNFGRQAAESSQNLQFADRSLTSAVFNLGNNTGVAVLGDFTHWYRPVRYELALTNGFGTFALEDRTELDGNLAVAFRMTEDILGDYGAGEGDIDLSPYAAMRVGFSSAFTRRTRRGPNGSTSEFDNGPAWLLVADPADGQAVYLMDQLPGVEQEYDLWMNGLEWDCKHAGWSFHAEYLTRWISNVQFETEHDFRDFTHGFYVQMGYFLTEKVECVGRHSTIYAQGSGSGSPVGRDYATTSNESGVGLNFYFQQNQSKLQLDLLYYDGAPISSSALNLAAGDQGWLFRTQYQIAF